MFHSPVTVVLEFSSDKKDKRLTVMLSQLPQVKQEVKSPVCYKPGVLYNAANDFRLV